MQNRRVVVTGLGALTPIGNTVEEFWSALLEGKSGAGPIKNFDASKFKTQFACEIKNFNVTEVLGDRRLERRTDKFVQYALAVSDQAVKDAGLDDASDEIKDEIGVLWSSGIGGLESLQKEIENFKDGDGTPRFSPLLVPKMIVDAAAGNISIRHKFKGITAAIVTACASATHASSIAFDLIRIGRSNIILVGGSEASVTEVGVGAFGALKALSKRNDDPTHASRPYDKNRDGFVLGEGAGAIVLEEYEHAKKRGATIYAELVGTAMTSDAYHITAPDPEGSGAANVMRKALKCAGMTSKDIDYINTHGTSTPLGDVMEITAIEKVFGEDAFKLNISSTKSMTGHLLGAAGAIESVICIKSICEGIVPATTNHEQTDPAINPKLNLTPNTPQKREVRAALSNSFGFGGHNSTIIFKKFEE
ncbi:MAG: 3-oxoacyl-[acyl-carrier-protein] synthase, KASII (EC [uncultured Aureispira sp.]|uniref:3-oxoacyl-[acyl-carrier-protein] synthase 2 n=1 Tax=uncultured Aureispira sp. TaxID=1331704 RepID=A0A6S6SIZ0_9BACT|nr:MAG: 3-oxoacyl-[acyl-carrier-protein] synthase, KASII (EC [uncultured Aureispira sp.]